MTVRDVFNTFSSGTKYSTKGAYRGRHRLGIQYDWTGTLAATPTLWASNHDDPSIADDTQWVQVTATLTSPAGSAGTFQLEKNDAHHLWYRLKFVHTGGSGNLNVRINHVAAATA